MRILSSVLRYFLLGIPSILRLRSFLHAFLPLFFLIIHIRGFCHLTANISAVIQQNQKAVAVLELHEEDILKLDLSGTQL